MVVQELDPAVGATIPPSTTGAAARPRVRANRSNTALGEARWLLPAFPEVRYSLRTVGMYGTVCHDALGNRIWDCQPEQPETAKTRRNLDK